ncbi:MAG: ion transporter [Coprococcus sp.]
MNKEWNVRRQRLAQIVEVGGADDMISRSYDFFSTIMLIINLIVTILYTFDSMEAHYGVFLLSAEAITVAFFAIDFILRLLTAKCMHPGLSEGRAILKYIFSLSGIIDLLSFLPYYMPFFFPTGAAAFRMFRVVRIFRLFRINAYYDSLNVITEVIVGKKQQLVSSVFIIMILMVASSLCMYSLEHEAQPDVFTNAFSGIWWAASTLLTVGYGDIYPVTTLGKIFGICITFLGVGMVAIPTGIISAGFVEQYSRLKKIGDFAKEEDVHFIEIKLKKSDVWTGKAIKDLGLPHSIIIAVIQRGSEAIVPRGDIILRAGDTLILGAEAIKDQQHIDLKEIVLRKQHPWNGMHIRDLDISRQTLIVMVKRRGTMLIPKGDLLLFEGDVLILYTKTHATEYLELE